MTDVEGRQDDLHHGEHHRAARCSGGCAGGPTRRRALAAGGALVATSTLVACGGGDAPSGGTSESPDAEGSTGDQGSGEEAIRVPLSDTPVGGSTYYEAEEIIVSQPTEGEVVVFDATCTHQGCMVSETGAESTLVCPCHNSVFASDSGEVLSGPATGPLGTLSAEIDGADVVISA